MTTINRPTRISRNIMYYDDNIINDNEKGHEITRFAYARDAHDIVFIRGLILYHVLGFFFFFLRKYIIV